MPKNQQTLALEALAEMVDKSTKKLDRRLAKIEKLFTAADALPPLEGAEAEAAPETPENEAETPEVTEADADATEAEAEGEE